MTQCQEGAGNMTGNLKYGEVRKITVPRARSGGCAQATQVHEHATLVAKNKEMYGTCSLFWSGN